MQNFVRYSAGIERDDPNVEESLQRILETMKRNMEGSVKAEGIGRAVREAHAKCYGLARGELEILDGLPPPYAQGIYTRMNDPKNWDQPFGAGSIHIQVSAFMAGRIASILQGRLPSLHPMKAAPSGMTPPGGSQ